ncbi:hypothetical protein [Chondromyces crocatus]|uniref:Uncharacterized protein n=1 Tax=Chondromyces crocatus TaxID=52 RepID=A0A0K1ET19_CHOCO|nr:hypothetical protein [Chondromyces crocatus]AKT43792.1 uncharacterized protein CMC5_080290 [Chondromyces crocatus]
MGTKDNAFVKYLLTLALTLPTATAMAAPKDGPRVDNADKSLSFSPNLENKLGLAGPTEATTGDQQEAAPGWLQIIWEEIIWRQLILVKQTEGSEQSLEGADTTPAADILRELRNEVV